MDASTTETVVRFLQKKPWVLVLGVVTALLVVVFLMQCAWTIRDGGSLTIFEDWLRLDVPTGAAAGPPSGSSSAEGQHVAP